MNLKRFRLRSTGPIWLLILIVHLYMSGVWLGVDRRMDTNKTRVLKRLDKVLDEIVNHSRVNKVLLRGPM